MSNNKQSSVEYLMDKLFDPSYMQKEQLEWFEQAKAMHKEEIENSFDIGANSYYDLNSPSNWEQYYNETYGGNK